METAASLSPLQTTVENPITQDNPQELQSSNLTKISTKTKVKAEIEITTLEGDHVTLSAKSLLKTFYKTYNAGGQMIGADSPSHSDIQGEGIYRSVSRSRISMEVEGSLNEDELADIQRLLQSIEGTFEDTLSGDMDGVLQNAIQMSSLGTLAGFDAEMKYSQKVRGMELIYQPLNTAPAPVPSETPDEPAPAPSDPSTAVASMMALRAKLYASLHLSGTQSPLEIPATRNPVVTPAETEAQTADAGPATPAPAPESAPPIPSPGQTETATLNTQQIQVNIKQRMSASLKGYGMDGMNVPSFLPESRMGNMDLLVLRQIIELENMLTASPVTIEESSMAQV